MAVSTHRERLVDRLVSDVQGGIEPEQAFEELFRRYYRPVVGFFIRRGFTEEESHDLAQEALIGVFKGIGRFRRHLSFEHWLFQISANVWRNELRRRSAAKRGGEDSPAVSIEALPASPDGGDPALDRDPLSEFLDNERLTVVRRAIDELPEQMRRCILLRVTAELSYREIADTLRLSIETVKSHLFQGRKRLRSTLADYFTDLSLLD